MYKLEILPIAKQDMDNIIFYIANNLKNISAAKKLIKHFINAINNLLEFPYSYSVFFNEKF